VLETKGFDRGLEPLASSTAPVYGPLHSPIDPFSRRQSVFPARPERSIVFGKLTAVRKAAKFGYRKYGLPGAVVAGLGGLVGYRFVRRKLGSRNRRE
jgi:hypothetical protein